MGIQQDECPARKEAWRLVCNDARGPSALEPGAGNPLATEGFENPIQ